MADIQFTMSVNDAALVRKTQEMAAATGRTIAEQSRSTMKSIVSYVMTYTPPASQKSQGRQAQAAGEIAVVRDMKKLFVEVDLKGKRPEQYPDPHALHHAAFAGAGEGGIKVPTKKYHVARAKVTALKTTLQRNVGLLASGWAPAALTLGINVPAWIARHAGSGRGTELQVTQQESRITMKVTNREPDTAAIIVAQQRRLVESAKRAAVGSMTRQIPYILKRQLQSVR
jgi:hypothetical protein